jgi:hypothetical protein
MLPNQIAFDVVGLWLFDHSMVVLVHRPILVPRLEKTQYNPSKLCSWNRFQFFGWLSKTGALAAK